MLSEGSRQFVVFTGFATEFITYKAHDSKNLFLVRLGHTDYTSKYITKETMDLIVCVCQFTPRWDGFVPISNRLWPR